MKKVALIGILAVNGSAFGAFLGVDYETHAVGENHTAYAFYDYFDFELPDSIGPVELRGATINKAGLEFRPTAGAPAPFALERALSSQAVRLLADPFVFGEKTPIGSVLGLPQALNPDSLAEGAVLQYDISTLIRLWSQAPADSVVPLRVGIVAVPENRELGFWEFFSKEDSPGVRPVIRVLFTPNPSFLLP